MTAFDPHLATGAFALDALDEDERALMEQHLATCDECRAEVSGLHATSARLGQALSTPPPASLKESVLAAAARTPQLPASTATRSNVRVLRPWSARILSAAAAILAVLAISATVVAVDQHASREHISNAAASVAAVLAAPDARAIPLSLDGSGTGAVVVSPSKDQAWFVANDLAPAPSGKVYELWMVTSTGEAQPAGLVQASGGGASLTPMAGDLTTAHSVAVTIEPEGGSTHPTSAPIGAVSLS